MKNSRFSEALSQEKRSHLLFVALAACMLCSVPGTAKASTEPSILAGESVSTQRQALIVKGKITDNTSQPLPGATVQVKGTTLGVSTDLNGNYEIELPSEDAVLVFSSIG